MKFEITGKNKGKNIIIDAQELLGMLEDSESTTEWEVKQI